MTRLMCAVPWCLLLLGCAGAQPLTAPQAWSFDDLAVGAVPAGFRVDATRGGGPLAQWGARADASAPSAPNILSLSRVDHDRGDTFNLCWTDRLQFGDGALQVAVRAQGGEEDQGGGLIWRARDHGNYYVARLNPLEHNLRLYFVKDQSRTMLASVDVQVDPASWHVLRVEQHGDHIVVKLDGRQLLEARDQTFMQAGGIGLWTKADATTDFDDLRVEPSK